MPLIAFALLQSEPRYTAAALVWLVIPGIVSGLVVLIASMAVYKRFLSSEFPGHVTRIEGHMNVMSKTLDEIKSELHGVMLRLVENQGELRNHDWRLRQLERGRDRGPDQEEPR